MRLIVFLLFLFFWNCGPPPIPEPQPARLILPSNLDRCTTATSLNSNESQVRFQWAASLDTDNYELVVINTQTNRKYSKSTALLTETKILPKGAPYQWYILSKSILSTVQTKSEVWQFYLEGNPETSHLPFPAQLITPDHDAQIDLDSSGDLTFIWEGNDLDQDIERYDFYLGTSAEELILEKENLTTSQLTLGLEIGITYYWQIKTSDSEGNSSLSQIYRFETVD